MNTIITRLTATLAALCAGCAAANVPPPALAQDGKSWIELSSSEALLPELEQRAVAAGCEVFEDPSDPYTSDAERIAVRCAGERLVIEQSDRWLGFQCGTLAPESCQNLMLALAPRCARGAGAAVAMVIQGSGI
jgi:hypothetical protein